MEKQTIRKPNKFAGTITVPGDKSISHRAVMLASIAEGKSIITNFLESEDCLHTKQAFQDMGIRFVHHGKALHVYGNGLYGLTPPKKTIDCGNSGTTIRLVSGILAGQKFTSVLTGDKYLHKRPMKRIIEPLTMMGARILAQNGEYAPLRIRGTELHGIEYRSPIASAQVKSCVLLAGLYAQGKTVVEEPCQSRDHTERMLKALGARLVIDGRKITIYGGSHLKGGKIHVPGDISSAAFFLVAGSIVPGAEVIIKNVGVNPTRNGIISVLKKMGAHIEFLDKRIFGHEPVADLKVVEHSLKSVELKGSIIPNIIDEIPIITVAATQAKGTTVIKNAGELRVKETDRIHSMATELSKMGAHIEEQPDGLVIHGPTTLTGERVLSHGDHRTAMSIIVAGLVAEGETVVGDTACIRTSFPQFFHILKMIGRNSG